MPPIHLLGSSLQENGTLNGGIFGTKALSSPKPSSGALGEGGKRAAKRGLCVGASLKTDVACPCLCIGYCFKSL